MRDQQLTRVNQSQALFVIVRAGTEQVPGLESHMEAAHCLKMTENYFMKPQHIKIDCYNLGVTYKITAIFKN